LPGCTPRHRPRDRCDPILINNLIYNCSNACIAIENSCNALLINNTFSTVISIRLFEMTDRVDDDIYKLTPGRFGHRSTASFGIVRRRCDWKTAIPNSTSLIARPCHGWYSDIKGDRRRVDLRVAIHPDLQEGNMDIDPLFTDPRATLSLQDYHLKRRPPLESGDYVLD
jgi:hypothetical protein